MTTFSIIKTYLPSALKHLFGCLQNSYVLFLKQIMQTTITFFMHKTSLFSIHMKRIRDMQITPISNTRMFIYFVYFLHYCSSFYKVSWKSLFLQTPIYDVIGYRKILFLPRDLDPKRLKDVILEFGLTNSFKIIYLCYVILLYFTYRRNDDYIVSSIFDLSFLVQWILYCLECTINNIQNNT
jgi:hypothetical protein